MEEREKGVERIGGEVVVRIVTKEFWWQTRAQVYVSTWVLGGNK